MTLAGNKWVLIHRVVLETFIGLAPHGTEACHANGDGKDNRLVNLRWATHLENMADAKRRDGSCWVRLDAEAVLKIRERIAAGIKQRDIAKEFGISQPTVSAINVGKLWRTTTGALTRPE